jgi:adenylate kinase family enzyme
MFLNKICDIDAPLNAAATLRRPVLWRYSCRTMRRVVVFGTTGSGKSTLAEALAARTGLRVIDLDALFWGRDWQPATDELFRHRVEREMRDDGRDGGGWIVVGNYGQVRDLTWSPADTLVWLDLPLGLVMSRLLLRTVKRIATRENLWGTGNRETIANSFFSRNSILYYAIRTHRRNRERFAIECAFLAREKTVVRLRTAREVERFITTA